MLRCKAFRLLLLLALPLGALVAIIWLRSPSINLDMIDLLAVPGAADRVLIVAPHCDDEVLGAGGLIMQALAAGAQVRVVIVTNGDNNVASTDLEFHTIKHHASDYIAAGEVRQQESLAALQHLGLAADDVYFLGFPDRGISQLLNANWSVEQPYRSRGTRDTSSPYDLSYEPGVVYAGEKLLGNLVQIMSDFQPDVVIGPHVDDRHPDHSASARFVTLALRDWQAGRADSAAAPQLYTYLIHHPAFPRPHGLHPQADLLPPLSRNFSMQWLRLDLSDEQEQCKREAVQMYATQLDVPELGSLLRSFVRRNELFERTDYAGN